MEIHRFAKRIGIVVSLSAAALLVSGSPAMAQEDDDVYQLPPVPTIVDQIPPVPPPVELPGTGTSTLQTSLTLGVSAAAIGGGLLLVARRRREPAVALG